MFEIIKEALLNGHGNIINQTINHDMRGYCQLELTISFPTHIIEICGNTNNGVESNVMRLIGGDIVHGTCQIISCNMRQITSVIDSSNSHYNNGYRSNGFFVEIVSNQPTPYEQPIVGVERGLIDILTQEINTNIEQEILDTLESFKPDVNPTILPNVITIPKFNIRND